MDDETFKACLLAIRDRIKWINFRHTTNSPQSERSGLIWATNAIDTLARRFIKAADWPGHSVSDDVRLGWELQWYMDYIRATAEVCKAAQNAVREKRLTLRSQLTRIPLDTDNLASWLNMDIDAVLKQDAAGFWPGILQLEPYDRWPDMVCMPPGAVDSQNLAEWAAAEGLAIPDESNELLTGKATTAQSDADPVSRLARLRRLGGRATYKQGEWKFTGITALVAAEKKDGRNRSTEKTIRADLKEAAQAERDEKRAGFGDGLGQR